MSGSLIHFLIIIKNSFYKEHKISKTNIFTKFQNKWETEAAIAKVINRHFDSAEIDTLGQKFDLISDGKDLINSGIFCNSVAEVHTNFDKTKLETLTDLMVDDKNKPDKIYYKHIMNELRLLKEAKKIEQIKMV